MQSKVTTSHRRVPRTCEICGSAFLARVGHVQNGFGRFCSDPCRSIHRRQPTTQRKEIPCSHCGEVMNLAPWQVKSGQKYCGWPCRNAAYLKGQALVCPVCGSGFYSHRSRPQTFCSKACQLHRRTPVERICEVCGKVFMASRHRVGKGGARWCSTICNGASRMLPLEHMWNYVNKDGPTPKHCPDLGMCWVWTGCHLASGGYGQIGLSGRSRRAHRLSWELATGESIPPRMTILHVCDNPPCVRNDDVGTYEVAGRVLPRRGHLALGTHQDNMRDLSEKYQRWKLLATTS